MDEQFIPIDIHYNKLLGNMGGVAGIMLSWYLYTDWLIDRHHCEAKWVGQVKVVQEKIGRAVKGVADNEEISKVLETSRKLFLYFCHAGFN